MPTTSKDGVRLRKCEWRHFNSARQGKPLAPEYVIEVLERLGRLREKLDGIEIGADVRELRREVAELKKEARRQAAEVKQLTSELEGARARALATEARHRIDLGRMEEECIRLREERDDFRQAARDADGRYFALKRQVAPEAA